VSRNNHMNPFTDKGIDGPCGVIINQVQKNWLIGMSASDRDISEKYIERSLPEPFLFNLRE